MAEKEYQYDFVVSGITPEQAEFIMQSVVTFVDYCKGFVGGGWSECKDEDATNNPEKRIAALESIIERSSKWHHDETYQYNAGYRAYVNGDKLEDKPTFESDHNQWEVGWVFAKHEAEKGKTCEWTYDPDTGHYDTACGEGFYFIGGEMLDENDAHKFCQYCGKLIETGEPEVSDDIQS